MIHVIDTSIIPIRREISISFKEKDIKEITKYNGMYVIEFGKIMSRFQITEKAYFEKY